MKITKIKDVNIVCGDCIDVMKEMGQENITVDAVITSPPYNVSRKTGDEYSTKYNEYQDTLTNEQYIEWQTALFNQIDKILNKDGVILYNINYGGENTDTLWLLLLANIINNTNFTVADQLIWKKKNAIPNNVSRNAITRICENVFVLCRKSEQKTFISNKKVISVSTKGQNIYENVLNIIEAPNNNQGEHTKVHKATYSVELCEELLRRYVPKDKVVLDTFSGSGTTMLACGKNGYKGYGIELDSLYVDLSVDRLQKELVVETIDSDCWE